MRKKKDEDYIICSVCLGKLKLEEAKLCFMCKSYVHATCYNRKFSVCDDCYKRV